MQVFKLRWTLAYLSFDGYWLDFNLSIWFISLYSCWYSVTAGIKKHKSIMKKKEKEA